MQSVSVPIAKPNNFNYTVYNPVGVLPIVQVGAFAIGISDGVFYFCSKESAKMLSQVEFKLLVLPNERLEKIVHDWMKDAIFFIGGSWYANKKGVKTITSVSEELRLRWIKGYSGIVKGAIEQRDNKNNWLGGYYIGDYNPFLLECFTRDSVITINDIQLTEKVIKYYLPEIEIISCYFCGSRFLNENNDGKWICRDCLSDFVEQKSINKVGFIYLFGSPENGYYKIGRGNNPPSRMKDYERSKLPFTVTMIHTIPADDCVKAEYELHRLFREKNTNGEWFKLTSEDVNKITGIKRYVSGRWIATQ